jgi:Plasmid pRiA4b ORF-3-like protein
VRKCVHAAQWRSPWQAPRTCETLAVTTWAPDPHRRGATIARRRARSWLSVRVELVEGRGERFWPRPGRLLAAARSHTFAQLATAIDDAFARWDRAHLHEFTLADRRRIGRPDPEFGTAEEVRDDRRTTLARLRAAEQFVYVFDFGDDWTHLCTVGDRRVDPLEALGFLPEGPLPFFGWGELPDQYGRRWDGDDGESPTPPDPGTGDLPSLRPWWGSGDDRGR